MDLGRLRENLKQLRRTLLKSIGENAHYDDTQLGRLADVQFAIEAVSAQIAAEGLTLEQLFGSVSRLRIADCYNVASHFFHALPRYARASTIRSHPLQNPKGTTNQRFDIGVFNAHFMNTAEKRSLLVLNLFAD
jgi:hypothetical protein